MHPIRQSMQFTSWKKRKQIAAALRPLYGADSAATAAAQLERLDAGSWGENYHAIARRAGGAIGTGSFRSSPAAVRRIVYTTKAIESLHSEVRKAVRGRGHFQVTKPQSD